MDFAWHERVNALLWIAGILSIVAFSILGGLNNGWSWKKFQWARGLALTVGMIVLLVAAYFTFVAFPLIQGELIELRK